MIVKSQFKKWKWKYRKGVSYELPIQAVPVTMGHYELLSHSGKALVVLDGRTLSIRRHYHFDGATNAPDFKSGLEWYAQHDAMCQLAAMYPAITREMADEVLNPRLRKAPLHLWIYYPAVRAWASMKLNSTQSV